MIGIFFIVGACLLWAIDTLIRYPLLGQGLLPESIVIYEHTILAAFFLPVLFRSRRKIMDAKISHLLYFMFVGGVGSGVATLAFTKAFTVINPSLVILLQKLQPVVAIVLARIVLRENIHKKFLYWAALCLMGGVLISYKDIFPGLVKLDFSFEMLNQNSLYGYGLTLLAVLGWGSSTVFGKKLSNKGYDEKEIMTGRFTFGLLFLLPLLTQREVFIVPSAQVMGKLGIMVALSGLIAMYLYYHGLKKISARSCSIAEMFFPFFAVIVNWIFLGATLDMVQITGGILLILGSTVIQLKHY